MQVICVASPTPRLGTDGISLGEFQLGNATAATKAHPRAAACTTALNYTWAALCKNAPNAETSRRCRKAGKCSPPPAQAHRPRGAAEPGVTGGGTACEHSLPGFRDRTARSGNTGQIYKRRFGCSEPAGFTTRGSTGPALGPPSPSKRLPSKHTLP